MCDLFALGMADRLSVSHPRGAGRISMDKAKYDEAINTIRTGAKVSEYYYHKPMVVAYSGGKDSDCVLQLVIESGVDFEVVHSLTTVDAPDTVYHVRKVQKRIREMGKKFEIHHPEMSIWKLIEKKHRKILLRSYERGERS